jgi:hypothetical protein
MRNALGARVVTGNLSSVRAARSTVGRPQGFPVVARPSGQGPLGRPDSGFSCGSPSDRAAEDRSAGRPQGFPVVARPTVRAAPSRKTVFEKASGLEEGSIQNSIPFDMLFSVTL